MTATAAASQPPSGRPLAGIASGSSRYRVVRNVPLLDRHDAIPKTIVEDGRPTRLQLGVNDADLADLARNSNRRSLAGKPPILQLGHTITDPSVPEPAHPRSVGHIDNFRIQQVEGSPCLCADLNILESEFDDAISFPRISVERSNWSDPKTHAISAVALIRRQPERDLPTLPYAASRSGIAYDGPTQLVTFSREFRRSSQPTYSTWLAGTGKTDTPRNRAAYDNVLAAHATRPDDALAEYRRRQSIDRHSYLSYCGRKSLKPADPASWDRWEKARATGDAG